MMALMAPETENLVLEHLRHIRGAVDRTADDVSELKTRVSRLEMGLAQAQVSLGHIQVALAEHSTRADA
jgi:hypothetical protein